MKKTMLGLLLTFVLLLPGCAFTPSRELGRTNEQPAMPTEPTPTADETAPSDKVIALLLYPSIDAAIQDHYGSPTQSALYEAVIERITPVDNLFSYEVTITVPTFQGAHNAPYGAETMTFAVSPAGVQLLAYTHEDAAP